MNYIFETACSFTPTALFPFTCLPEADYYSL
jgi:hypothetical protein